MTESCITDGLPFTIIHLSPRWGTCVACGIDIDNPTKGIPVWGDYALPNDWEGEWGGADACDRCFDLQGTLTAPMLLIELSAIGAGNG